MIVLATMHNTGYTDLAKVTYEQNKEVYCNLHDYVLTSKTDNWSDVVYYDKIQYLIDILENNTEVSWIWWLDCDALITNFTKKIEDVIDDNYHIIISTDVNGINCGSFFVRNSPEALNWLKHIYSTRSLYLEKRWDNPEQTPMIMTYIKYRDIIKLLPQKEINSYLYELYPGISNIDMLHTNGQWTQGDWVLHLPGIHNLKRIAIFEQFQKLIVHGEANESL